jgi:hypothetical protein
MIDRAGPEEPSRRTVRGHKYLAIPFALLAVAAAAGRAAATPYETFIDIDDQADLEDLLAAGDVTQDTYNELLDLLEVGVDLSTADRAQLYALPNLTYDDVDRILAYREKQNGMIRDPAALVAAGALSSEKLLAISAFLTRSRDAGALGVRGWVRAMSRFGVRDKFLPPLALRGRFSAPHHLQAGFAAVFTRLEIGAPVYDPNRGALIADRRGYGAAVPKIFLKYEDADGTAIAGSFRAGFGQRLVFDNSQHYTPNGLYLDDELYYAQDLERECHESAGELAASPCAGAAGGRYVTPDFRYRDGLLGVGAGWKRLSLGAGWLQAYAWASSVRRSIYQYELVDRERCPDPHDDGDPACAAPTVLVRPDGAILTPTSRFSFETLPRVFEERLAGANVTYFADRRNAVGLTAYGATLRDLVDGIELDTQEWSRLPTGRRYGAIGAHFSLGRDWLDVFGEAALSVDRLPDDPAGPQEGGGGPAALLRVTATQKRQELEASLRYYGVDYANPYARPISQPDEFEGQRARDEVGARLRYYRAARLSSVRALLDLWYPVSSLGPDSVLGRSQPKLDSYLRADVRTTRALRLGLWLRLQDKDLLASGHEQCFEVSVETDERGEPIPCGGRQLTTSARARLDVDRALSVTAMLEHQLVDDGQFATSPFKEEFRQDLSGWLVALWRPDGKLRVRGRARYLHEAVNDGQDDYLERSLSALLDASLGLRARDVLRARADLKLWLDHRDATLLRSPNPELQLWLSYEARL